MTKFHLYLQENKIAEGFIQEIHGFLNVIRHFRRRFKLKAGMQPGSAQNPQPGTEQGSNPEIPAFRVPGKSLDVEGCGFLFLFLFFFFFCFFF